jgi:phosphoketolase
MAAPPRVSSAATLEHCVREIREIQETARRAGKAFRLRWPMIILRSPKGWSAPRQVDGHYLEGFWRARRIPLPDVKVRLVNVVDLFKLVQNTEHPHGLTDREFAALFTADKPVVFNFHGYAWLIHRLTYHHPHQQHIHVRGYKELGNVNTPLELAIRKQADRFSLAIDAIDRMPRFRVTASSAREALLNQQIGCKNPAYEFGIDMAEIADWLWPF